MEIEAMLAEILPTTYMSLEKKTSSAVDIQLDSGKVAVEVPKREYVAVTPFVPMPIVLFVASTVKVLEILAVVPDEDAISKYASGVVSPRPNLPDEVVENLAKGVEAVFLTTRSLSKSQPPEM